MIGIIDCIDITDCAVSTVNCVDCADFTFLTTWNQEMLAHLKKGPFSSNFGEHLKHTEIFYCLKRGPKLANINTKIQVNFPYYY